MTTDSSHLIAVLGMHRSGTSAVSRSLQVLGVSLGENLMPAHSEINAKGFWEDTDFVNLNMEIATMLGRAWHSVAPISTADLQLIEETDLGERALALVQERLNANRIYGLKDPRLANLSAFWLPIFRETGAQVSAVLSVRHPTSVARSLAKRDGFTAEHGYLLWIDHVLSSVYDTAGQNRVIVDYDLLMTDPQHQLHRMSQQLGLPIVDSEFATFKNEFLDDKLRHTAFDLDDLNTDPSCPPIVRDCYGLLLEASKDNVGVDSESFKQQISAWHHEYDRNLPMLQLLDERWKEITTLEHHRARVAELAQETSALIQKNKLLESAVQRLESNSQRLENARSALESRTHELVDQLGREKSATAQQQAANNQLTSTLNLKEREMIDIRHSTSWRITAPIRWIRERFVARSTSAVRK